MKWTITLTKDLFVVCILGATTMAACGGSTPAAETPSDDGGDTTSDPSSAADAGGPEAGEPEAGAPETQPNKSFDEMSPPERMSLMKKVVLPEMTNAFQEFDREEFAEVSCATCHGPGAKNGDFEMPSAALPALDQEEMAEHPEVTKFMKEIVVPKMAAILGEQPYNPETHEGFGCFDCHTKKE